MGVPFRDFISSDTICITGPDGKTFNVHSNLVIKCSSVLEKIVRELPATTKQRTVRFNEQPGDIDDATVLRFIEFAYTDDYTTRTPHNVSELSATNVPCDEQNRITQWTHFSTPSTSATAHVPAQSAASQNFTNPFWNLLQDLQNNTVTNLNTPLLRFPAPLSGPFGGLYPGTPVTMSSDKRNQDSFNKSFHTAGVPVRSESGGLFSTSSTGGGLFGMSSRSGGLFGTSSRGESSHGFGDWPSGRQTSPFGSQVEKVPFGNVIEREGPTASSRTGGRTMIDRAGRPKVQSEQLNEGTVLVPFTPTFEQEGLYKVLYQSIPFQYPYYKHSFEELRLADYNAGRRFGNGSGPPHTLRSDGFGEFHTTGPDDVVQSCIECSTTQLPFGATPEQTMATTTESQLTWQVLLSQAWNKHTEYWTLRAQRSGWDTSTPDFMCHAKLYVFSKHYACEALSHLSLRKMQLALASCDPASCTSDAIKLITYVYAHTTAPTNGAEPLGALVIDYAFCHLENIMKETQFRDLIRHGGDFADDLMVKLAQRLL